jgi:HSP90 family molecular chaperone
MITHNLKFDIDRTWRPSASGTFVMSDHAMKRMFERSLSPKTVRLTLRHGEPTYGEDVRIYRVGKKQVSHVGHRIRQAEGVQIVVDHGGTVVTLYRSSDF